MKQQLSLFLLLLALGIPARAIAQTHPCDTTPPTAGTGIVGATLQVQFCHDGKDATGTVTITPTSFRIYDNGTGATITMTKGTTSPVSGKSLYTGSYVVTTAGSHALQTSALVGAIEGAKSNTFTLTATSAVPSAPTSLVVQ